MSTHNKQTSTSSKTRRKHNNNNHGWTVVSVKGTHYEMGLQHGRILRKQIEKTKPVLAYLVKKYYKTGIREYVSRCKNIVEKYKGQKEWQSIFEELQGIGEGSGVSVDFLIAWNMFLSVNEIYESRTDVQRCSAFIATGSKTHDGKIIMAHNTHCDFSVGFISNVVMYMYPENGIPFVMQTIAGLVCSSTDWFISESGIIGCETTIADINYKPDFKSGVPYFFRIRKAIEFGRTLDDYVSIMMEKNAGDYACSWLFGDINSGEILRLELAKKTHGIERTFDGVFYGMNCPFTPEIISRETTHSELNDLKTSPGSRNIRLNHLLLSRTIDLSYAKKILSDHYDSSENAVRKGIRSICKHKEVEKGKDFNFSGAVDGKVVDSTLARQMRFIGRMGSSCGRVFNKSDYPDGEWKHVTLNMPKYDWVTLKGTAVPF